MNDIDDFKDDDFTDIAVLFDRPAAKRVRPCFGVASDSGLRMVVSYGRAVKAVDETCREVVLGGRCADSGVCWIDRGDAAVGSGGRADSVCLVGAVAPAACYGMNEAAGATTMFDSGPNKLHASISQKGPRHRICLRRCRRYHWARKDPNSLPVAPERIIQIADNVTQKGQSATGGGHWKIEHPMGLALCLFKGSVGRVPTLSPVAVNDSAWGNAASASGFSGNGSRPKGYAS